MNGDAIVVGGAGLVVEVATRWWDPDLHRHFVEAPGALAARAAAYDPRSTGGGRVPEVSVRDLAVATRLRHKEAVLERLPERTRAILRASHDVDVRLVDHRVLRNGRPEGPLREVRWPRCLGVEPPWTVGQGPTGLGGQFACVPRATPWTHLGEVAAVAVLLAGPDAVLAMVAAAGWPGTQAAKPWRRAAIAALGGLRSEALAAVAEALRDYRRARSAVHAELDRARNERMEAGARRRASALLDGGA